MTSVTIKQFSLTQVVAYFLRCLDYCPTFCADRYILHVVAFVLVPSLHFKSLFDSRIMPGNYLGSVSKCSITMYQRLHPQSKNRFSLITGVPYDPQTSNFIGSLVSLNRGSLLFLESKVNVTVVTFTEELFDQAGLFFTI